MLIPIPSQTQEHLDLNLEVTPVNHIPLQSHSPWQPVNLSSPPFPIIETS